MTPQTWSRQELHRDLERFTRGYQSLKHTQFYVDEREELIGPLCTVTAVFRENGDVVLQLFPKSKKWPSDEVGGRALLTDLLDVYFGDVARFSGSHVPELNSWAVRAQGLALLPSYDRNHHVYGFATYVNIALDEL